MNSDTKKRKRTSKLPPFEKTNDRGEKEFFCNKACKAYSDKDCFTATCIKSKRRCCKTCYNALYSKFCKHPGCKTRAAYGLAKDRKRIACKTHATEEMIHLSAKRCGVDGCYKIPVFGVPGGKATRCSGHKEDGMVDVVHERCNHPGCDKRTRFGVPGGNPTRCSGHKEENMVDLVSPKCTYCKDRFASFGYADDNKRVACGGCRKPGMVNLSKKICLTESCKEYTYESFKGCEYCYQCHCRRNGETPKNSKVKEMHFDEFIREIWPDMIYNQKFPGTRFYPDWYMFFERFLFVIELDEFQHKSYDEQSEKERIQKIFDKSDRKHLIVLRINPDSYTNDKGLKVHGCYKPGFDQNKLKRLVKIHKELDRRTGIVKKTIRNIIDNADTIVLDEEITTKKLFFDEF